MSKEKKKNYKMGVYMRVGDMIYTSIYDIKRDVQREKVMKKLTPEQIALCEKIKQEIEGKKYVPMR